MSPRPLQLPYDEIPPVRIAVVDCRIEAPGRGEGPVDIHLHFAAYRSDRQVVDASMFVPSQVRNALQDWLNEMDQE